MNHSTPGLPVHHQLPEFTQTHVHWASFLNPMAATLTTATASDSRRLGKWKRCASGSSLFSCPIFIPSTLPCGKQVLKTSSKNSWLLEAWLLKILFLKSWEKRYKGLEKWDSLSLFLCMWNFKRSFRWFLLLIKMWICILLIRFFPLLTKDGTLHTEFWKVISYFQGLYNVNNWRGNKSRLERFFCLIILKYPNYLNLQYFQPSRSLPFIYLFFNIESVKHRRHTWNWDL